MRVSGIRFTVRDIETDVEFVDDVDRAVAAIPESADVYFVDSEFESMTFRGRGAAGFYGCPTITDWESLSEPWRSVAASIIAACKV